mgnify:CR=1 FL=1
MSSMIYPYQRDWKINSVNFGKYTSLKNNWSLSKEQISKIRALLSQGQVHQYVDTVAVAGSLGRMEVSNASDADIIVVLDKEVELNSQVAREAYESVWQCLKPLNLERPKPTGVFADPTNISDLTTNIGKASEVYNVFGKRLLLLLESQPLYQDLNYSNLLDQIIDKYAFYIQNDSTKEWTLLLNDLIRYFRSLAVNYQWDFDFEGQKWAIRNIKLRHSRLVMYAGLLLLLGEASKERQDKMTWLKQKLNFTPLERIAWVYEQSQDWNFFRIAGLYNVFLSNISDPTIRSQLNLDYQERYENEVFARLKANSDGLIAELLRFVLARRGDWTERFFEYLIF